MHISADDDISGEEVTASEMSSRRRAGVAGIACTV